MTSPPLALVTGANRGLGRSTALALAASGARVVVTYRGSENAATETVDEIQSAGGEAVAAYLDISDVGSFTTFVTDLSAALSRRWQTSRLDVVVNNAGVGLFGALENVTTEQFDQVMGTNVRGTFFLIQALVPLMDDGGCIVNVSTSLTRHVSPSTSVYAASKTALEAITRSLAVELGPRRIRVNSIAPGPTATDFNSGAMRDDPQLRKTLGEHTALGRVGQPEEIGDAIAALVSDQMRWITAERIEVSGGTFL